MIERLDPAVPLLQVFDMRTSLTFYCDVIGFEVVDRTDPDWWAMIRLGGAELNTAYEDGERPESADPERVRGHRDVSLYFGFRDLEGLHAHLRNKGFDVPHGYELCFTAPLEVG